MYTTSAAAAGGAFAAFTILMLLAGFLVDIVQHWLEDWRRGRLCSMGCSECILFASASAGTAVLPF